MTHRTDWLSETLAVLVSAALLAVAPLATASDTLVPHSAEYKIRISIASGTLSTEVRETHDGFAARSVIRPTGLARLFMSGTIEESSRFATEDDGVRPLVYASSDTLSDDPKQMDFVFDWTTSHVAGTINDEVFDFELDGQVHDRVSIQYQLMHNLLSGASSGDYAMLDGDEIKELQVTLTDPRRIKVPYGTFEAVGVRHHATNSDRVTTLWCVEELGYLPVLIEQHQDGRRRVRAMLTSYSPGETGERAISASN